MDYANILFETAEGIATLTINRPKAMNALDAATLNDIDAAVGEVANNPDIRALIITGAGGKAFVAGADITQFLDMTGPEGKDFAGRGQAVFSRIESLGKPVIAAINGFALGGGCELAMSCHLRVASENAKLSQPEVNLGLIPGFGGTQRLPRLVGLGIAAELLLTGNMIDAAEAHRIGLVNKVVPQAELLATCRKIAGKIMSKAPKAVTYSLEALYRGAGMTLADATGLEADLFGMTCATEDKSEGVKAFMEKRKPEFQGK